MKEILKQKTAAILDGLEVSEVLVTAAFSHILEYAISGPTKFGGMSGVVYAGETHSDPVRPHIA